MSGEFDPDDPTWDRQLRVALDEVTVPAGLTERMLAALETPTAVVAIAPSRSSPSRRRMLWGGLAATALILLLSTAILLNQGPGVGSANQLQVEAITALSAYENATDWNQDLEQASLRAFPWDRWLRQKPLRWRSTQLAGDAAVIYDLAPGGAILLVVSTRKNFALASAPLSTLPPTSSNVGSFATTAWQQPALVYVLATDTSRRFKPNGFLKEPKVVQNAAPGPHVFASR